MQVSRSSSPANRAIQPPAAAPGASSAPRIERIALDGPSRSYDSRIHAIRPDLAEYCEAALAFAPHYARAEPRRLIAAAAPLLAAPRADARAVSQMLCGEDFALLDIQGGWAWGYSVADHYVGYLDAALLGPEMQATHIVAAREAILFAEADIKSPIRGTLSLGARIAGTESERFVETAEGYVHRRHLIAASEALADYVATAETLLGAPYRWGGRGAGGIDCSGLVQLALGLAGHPCPRDSDMQATLGREIEPNAELARGDLIFFPGHVGIMADAHRLLHANAHWMAVVIEPLTDVVARLKPTYDRPITARRRLSA